MAQQWQRPVTSMRVSFGSRHYTWPMGTLARLLLAACLTLAGLSATAQTYPNKPIRIIVPFPPGGGVDIVSRAIAEKLSPRLGQPMPVDNRPGAGMTIALDAAVRSAPDGYTVLLAPIGSLAISTLMHPKLTF